MCDFNIYINIYIYIYIHKFIYINICNIKQVYFSNWHKGHEILISSIRVISCEKKRGERQRKKGKIFPFECRVPKDSKER